MTKEVIAIPRETFDLMQMALEGINHLDADINFLNTNELEEMMDKALSAAKAVSEPKLGAAVGELASPEYDQLRARVQPTAMPFVPWYKEAEMLKSWTVQPQAQEPKLPEYFAQYEYAPDFSVIVSVYRRRPDDVPELIHSEALPKQIDAHPQASEPAPKEALTDQHLQAAILCREAGRVSVSLVQRKLKTGYVAAQDICQKIIDAGLVAGLTIAPSLTTPAAPEATK